MFLLSRPSDADIRGFLAGQHAARFSYAEVGFTRNAAAPAGFNVDHNRVLLGHGQQAFAQATAAIRRWQMFAVARVELCWPTAPIATGAEVAVLARHFGFWSLNAARVVYTVNESGEVQRFGFAYGTLRDHAESGEERFLVEWDRRDDSVSYDLFAFSRPQNPLARIAKPLARRLQREFARESKAAMLRAMSVAS